VSDNVLEVVENVESAKSPKDIRNLKKLKGFKNAFRIIIGDYRIGVFIENDTLEFARIAHRKKFYNIFP
jgi:mRNA interferase RelE/StbE